MYIIIIIGTGLTGADYAAIMRSYFSSLSIILRQTLRLWSNKALLCDCRKLSITLNARLRLDSNHD